jgi:predicted transport protein
VVVSEREDAALQSMIRGLETRTGRSLEEWLKVAKRSGLQKHGQVVAFLKESHGVTHGYANLIAHSALKSDAASAAEQGVDLVAAQYAGAKAALRPLYETLAARVRAFGKDVEVSPKKAYVSLRRSKQFGLLQPSTATRLDVGVNLKGVPAKGRLEASGSFNSMCTHRVRIESAEEIDSELLSWLREAYDRA